MMGQLIASVVLILSFLGAISLGCLMGGVVALFDGSPLWFGIFGILLGIMGLFSTHYHLSLALNAYRKVKAMPPEDEAAMTPTPHPTPADGGTGAK